MVALEVCRFEGAGAVMLDLLEDPTVIFLDARVLLVQVIDEGVEAPLEFPGVMLPRAGMSLTDEDVQALAAYVWSIANAG